MCDDQNFNDSNFYLNVRSDRNVEGHGSKVNSNQRQERMYVQYISTNLLANKINHEAGNRLLSY